MSCLCLEVPTLPRSRQLPESCLCCLRDRLSLNINVITTSVVTVMYQSFDYFNPYTLYLSTHVPKHRRFMDCTAKPNQFYFWYTVWYYHYHKYVIHKQIYCGFKNLIISTFIKWSTDWQKYSQIPPVRCWMMWRPRDIWHTWIFLHRNTGNTIMLYIKYW